MKKIGILTYFWADNPGTFLQAYATFKQFSSIFSESSVEIVDCKHRAGYYRPSLSHIKTRKVIAGYRRHKMFQHLVKDCLRLSGISIVSKKRNKSTAFLRNRMYDLIVVGSDTVLQFLPFHYKRQEVPIYWVPKDIPGWKVICAASSSALSVERMNSAQADECKNSIEHFDLIGVRDEATYNLMLDLGIRNIDKLMMVPDPTFCFDIDCSHAEKLLDQSGFDHTREWILLDLPRRFRAAERIAEHFRKLGYAIISFVPADYADICLISISPFEWAGVYKYCRLTITQRFHGTIFSLKNLVPVVTVVWTDKLKTPQGLSKHLSLLKSFNMQESNYVDGSELADLATFFEKTERVMSGFDKKAIGAALERAKKDYLRFVMKVKALDA